MSEKTVPWKTDKLNRQSDADFLINYLNAIHNEIENKQDSKGFVLNLNAGWGYGKTFFLENLMLDLNLKKHPVLYFDAWRNDYSKSPLLAFISELNESLREYESKLPVLERAGVIKSFSDKSKQLLGSMLAVGTNVLVKKLTSLNVDELKELAGLDQDQAEKICEKLGEKSEEFVSDLAQKNIEDHKSIKNMISEFKIKLYEVTQSLKNEGKFHLPMYVLVDELDRCRPNYAIELLEDIKHLFEAKGIIFIIATNKNQLTHSINAVYGNNFDSFNYLKRFFNQEYELPLPNYSSFIAALFTQIGIKEDSFFVPLEPNINGVANINLFIFEELARAFDLGLRDVDQVCIKLKAIQLTNNVKSLHFLFLLFVLIIKHKNQGRLSEITSDLPSSKLVDFKKIQVFVMDYTNGGGETRKEIHIHELIDFYLELSKETAGQINKRFNGLQSLYKESILHVLTSESGVARNQQYSISMYESLADQAGHIRS